MSKEKIRPLYGQLKGYMSQAPLLKDRSTDNKVLWESFNNVIDELNKITELGKYDKFRIEPVYHAGGNGWLPSTDVRLSTYRANLAGLISNLHAEYFSDQLEPFNGVPGTVINQAQNQTQTQSMQVTVLQLQEKIIQKLSEGNLEEKEVTFLEKLKGTLPKVTNVFQLVATIIELAKECGIDLATLANLLNWS